MWGMPDFFRHGLIPAHAGKTERQQPAQANPEAHPRSRGENTSRSRGSVFSVMAHPRSRGENRTSTVKPRPDPGSSPLTRGKRSYSCEDLLAPGLIPAHAGKTQSWWGRRGPPRAHPRSRGENRASRPALTLIAGSSPLTRGKRDALHMRLDALRLIPAHAGKTASCTAHCRRCKAHPRSRGENMMCAIVGFPVAGSSPLTRGKLHAGGVGDRRRGLIPAHAGKTQTTGPMRTDGPAHPRSRGENPLRPLFLRPG